MALDRRCRLVGTWLNNGMDQWTVVLLAVVAIGLVMVFAGSRAQERARAAARHAAIERKLDLVMRHLGIAEPLPEEPEVVQHLERGERIQAIKVYRERTGVGLAEAKEAVDRIARERGLGLK
jgi:ribosomal protein L7/L12